MKMNRHFPTVARLLLLAAMAVGLSGCLSHWFTDSTTRLQIENKTNVTFYGLDIVSEDGTSIVPWISDTLEPGERSRVYEQDWVGTFKARLKMGGRCFLTCKAQASIDENAALRSATDILEPVDYIPSDSAARSMTYGCIKNLDIDDFELDGGSLYLVISHNEYGHLQYEFR